jgi:SAM-dependent methyltransferase
MPTTKDHSPTEALSDNPDEIVGQVRDRYAQIAEESASCCSGCSVPGVPEDSAEAAQRVGYSTDELASIPDSANMGLGCGAPLDYLDLQHGETVLDLGSGGGIDAFIAAKQVGAAGRVLGVDMTPEMISKAVDGARRAGLDHVEFRQGRLEELPVEDASIDAVTSNCVINLVPDKAVVFREVARVLKTGGRLVISDIVLEEPLPEAIGRDLLAYVGCVAGAMLREDYFGAARAAGLEQIEVLRDVDGFVLLGGEVPAEARELLARTGTDPEELRGKVRSITYRAVKT